MIPGTKSTERRALQKKRWLRDAQKRLTGCEGRIRLLERRHGLIRCRSKRTAGMKRWVGLGVIADNLNRHRPRNGRIDRAPGLITVPAFAPESS